MAVRQIDALELSQILGSLLDSVIKAQASSADATVAFVENVGVESTADGDRLRTVKIRYQKKDEDGAYKDFEVEVPLLSMVNVPSLRVKEAVMSFAYDVVTATPLETDDPGKKLKVLDSDAGRAKLTGFVRHKPAALAGSDQTAKQTTAIDVRVTVEQSDLPVGVERLFDLAELGIAERSIEK